MTRKSMPGTRRTGSFPKLVWLVLVVGLLGSSAAPTNAISSDRDPMVAYLGLPGDGVRGARAAADAVPPVAAEFAPAASRAMEPGASQESKLASSTAVPRIGTWAMVLSGLGLVCLVIRRRSLVMKGSIDARPSAVR